VPDLFEEPDHATPLTPEERLDLIPTHIAFRSELNEAEQENIARAQAWALGRKRDLLSEKFIRELHRRMLGDVWKWAQIDYKTYPVDEIAVRFHHRIVQIQLFPNGNGRHARLMADLLAMRMGRDQFSWGRESLRDAGTTRRLYIAALQAADNHDIAPLLAFARS
jgi:fido (protein-threonine AMPylation protein)